MWEDFPGAEATTERPPGPTSEAAYREGLLFLRDVGVLVAPVVQQLLLLAVIDPHDLSGGGLDDVLQLPQVVHALEGCFLHGKGRGRLAEQVQGESALQTHGSTSVCLSQGWSGPQ